MEKRIKFWVNEKEYDLEVPTHKTLLYVLRDLIGLTGTKEGCGKGECGACTVLLNGKIVNACLVLAVMADGSKITTIEGVSGNKKIHPLQHSFVKEGAIQCGYCTPGMIMAAKYLLDNNPSPSNDEIAKGISGNLCRCTGYTKIIKAIARTSERGEEFSSSKRQPSPASGSSID